MNKVYIILQHTFSCNTQVRSVWSTKPLAQKSINTINAKIKDRDCFEIKELEIKLKENE